MTVVQETLVLPGDVSASFAIVTVQLAGPDGAAFVPPDETLVAYRKVRADIDGFWTLDLTPNDEIVPAGTTWRRTVTAARTTRQTVADDYFVVPASGGPYEIQALLTDPPDAIPSSGLSAHISTRGAGAHLPDGGNVGEVPIRGLGGTVTWGPQTGSGGQVDSVVAGAGLTVDNTDPTAPVVGLDAGTVSSLGLADTAVQPSDTDASALGWVSNDSTLADNSATEVPTEQAVKTYVDTMRFIDSLSYAAQFAPISVVPKLDAITGLYGGKVGMHRWRTRGRDLKHLICFGDSVTQGVGISDGVNTKTDGYPDHLRTILRDTLNGEIHEGFQPIYWMSSPGGSVRWSSSGGWTNVGGLAENLGPHGQSESAVRSNNDTLRTLTWTRPAHVRLDRVIVYWVDDANVTAGAFWSYSTDGGSSWTEVATASPGSPTLMATEITGLSDPTDFSIRNANAVGTTYAVSPTFLGIDVRNGASGWVVHNMGQSGASLANPLSNGSSGAAAATRLGDWTPLFDLLEPELVILNFSNDCTNYDQATFETAIEEVVGHLDSLGTDILHYGFPDQVRINQTHRDNLPIVRQHITDKVLEYNGVAVHMHERWTSVAQSKALGYMANVTFPIHPTRAGDLEVASTLARTLRSYC